MWSLKDEENDQRCRAVGPPTFWRVVCHACGHKFPILPGAPGSGAAHAMKCCGHENLHFHDLRIPCDWCRDDKGS